MLGQIWGMVKLWLPFLAFGDDAPVDPLVDMLLPRIRSVAHVTVANGVRWEVFTDVNGPHEDGNALRRFAGLTQEKAQSEKGDPAPSHVGS